MGRIKKDLKIITSPEAIISKEVVFHG